MQALKIFQKHYETPQWKNRVHPLQYCRKHFTAFFAFYGQNCYDRFPFLLAFFGLKSYNLV